MLSLLQRTPVSCCSTMHIDEGPSGENLGNFLGLDKSQFKQSVLNGVGVNSHELETILKSFLYIWNP